MLAISAIETASAESLHTLLVDFNGLWLTRRLSVVDCYEIGRRLARAGARLVRVAFILRDDCAQEHQLLFDAACNRGLRAAVFADESAALRWLEAAC